MTRYRLLASPAQEKVLRDHCAHARFVWNLAVEQQSWWRPGRRSAPGWVEQCRQLSQARGAHAWLAAGSVMVHQQALRDFSQARANFFTGTHGRPTWRKAGRDEGFRVVALRPGQVRRLNRHWGQVFVPKAGWVRFRWSRAVPQAKSFRVRLDRAGRWHVAFAVVPSPIEGPGAGEQKAPRRVQKINPAYTSQRCSACGHVAGENRKSQAVFACTACGFAANADVNAATSIAAGHALTARGGLPLGRPVNREPQLALLSA
jgi:putative transposase